ncbi:hypothetical protein AAMO2058_000043500 [Amorphochlora amoebiformis]
MSVTVAVQFSVIFTTTAMTVHLMGDSFDPMATDCLSFLRREFEYPYISTRFEFLAGLLTFICGIAIKSFVSLCSFPTLSQATTLLLLSTAGRMLAFDSVMGFDGIPHLVKRYLQLQFSKIQIMTPLSSLSLLCGIAAGIQYWKAISKPSPDVSPSIAGNSS